VKSGDVLHVTNRKVVVALRALGHQPSVRMRPGQKTLYLFGPRAFADLDRALQEVKTYEDERREAAQAAQAVLPMLRSEPIPCNGRWVEVR
jgi:hypothetical protein